MNYDLLREQLVFDSRKLKSGSVIEIQGDSLQNDLIRYNAIITKVELDRIEFAHVDPETKEMAKGKLYLSDLSDEINDGWLIKLIV